MRRESVRASGVVNRTSELGVGMGSRMFAPVRRFCSKLRTRSSPSLHDCREIISASTVEL